MKLYKLAFRRETYMPVVALLIASGASVFLVAGRIVWTGDIHYAFLVWNLFLAWLPLIFSLLACDEFATGAARGWRFCGFASSWLLFFPNAPYIWTDLIHLKTRFYGHFWIDMVLILLCALTGLVLGFVSLYLMQSVVRRALGLIASWCFIVAVAMLSGFGIYLGRFLRFNSWDIFWQPLALSRGIGKSLLIPLFQPQAAAFPLLFGVFIFMAYLMLYGLTHLGQVAPAEPQPG
jgi:uncharacterized membrane protein